MLIYYNVKVSKITKVAEFCWNCQNLQIAKIAKFPETSKRRSLPGCSRSSIWKYESTIISKTTERIWIKSEKIFSPGFTRISEFSGFFLTITGKKIFIKMCRDLRNFIKLHKTLLRNVGGYIGEVTHNLHININVNVLTSEIWFARSKVEISKRTCIGRGRVFRFFE